MARHRHQHLRPRLALATYHALRLQPTEVTSDARVGLRWRARGPWTAIASVEPVGAGAAVLEGKDAGKRVLDGRILAADVLVRLREPVVTHGPFGLRRPVHTLVLSIDTPDSFVSAVRTRVGV